MYVLVLGLDVLGNPFGLIRGLSEGVEAFFYEPYQVRREGGQEDDNGELAELRTCICISWLSFKQCCFGNVSSDIYDEMYH